MSERKQPRYVTESQQRDDMEGMRGDFGVLLGKARDEWAEKLRLELQSFKNEIRVLLLGTVLVLKFHLPTGLTAGAVGLVGLKAAWGFFSRS